MRRYFVPGYFGLWDARAHHMHLPQDHWEENVKALHLENRIRVLAGLEREYGIEGIEIKIQNFQEIGDSPLSIVSYHNLFFRQARQSFVIGAYYPALIATCALGERILNHLILDLREHFRSSNTFKKVRGKKSIDDWDHAVDVLEDWKILEPGISENFRKLKLIRHRSIHFNAQTYQRVREDARQALEILKEIITGQFGAFGTQRWFIKGTRGACFIKKEFESDPFVKTFYLPQCPLVGYRYALKPLQGGAWLAFDQEMYEGSSLTDEEFCDLYNNRELSDLVSDDIPPKIGIVTWLLVTGEASRVILEASPTTNKVSETATEG